MSTFRNMYKAEKERHFWFSAFGTFFEKGNTMLQDTTTVKVFK